MQLWETNIIKKPRNLRILLVLARSVKKTKERWTIETFFVNVFLLSLRNPRQCKNKPFIGLQLVVMWFIPLVRCPWALPEGNKSHNPSLRADNPYLQSILHVRPPPKRDHLSWTSSWNRSPVFDSCKWPPPVTDHSIFEFWVFTLRRFDCILDVATPSPPVVTNPNIFPNQGHDSSGVATPSSPLITNPNLFHNLGNNNSQRWFS